MNFLFLAGGLAAIVFILTYLRPGRYGIATLALIAGHTLALFWADALASTYRHIGLELGIGAWYEVIYAVLVLIPMVFVLLFSKKQHEKLPRLVSSILLGVVAVVLLVPILSLVAPVTAQGQMIYDFMNHYRALFITLALLVALVEVSFGSTPKLAKHHGKD